MKFLWLVPETKMGGLFSSPASSSDSSNALATSFARVYKSNGFAKVIDVFVGESEYAAILVLYGDGKLQSWGTMMKTASWLPGPKFSMTDTAQLVSWAEGIKVRQSGKGIDSAKSAALEQSLSANGVPLDVKMGRRYVCGLVQKARILSGSSQAQYEEC